MARKLIRPDLLGLSPVEHGSVTAAELAPFGLKPSDVIDFSVNINPLGPAPTVMQAIHQTDWTRYPGDDVAPLRSGLARKTGVLPEQVVLGNGSAELLWSIALAVLEQPNGHATVLGPTFGEYARAARSAGADVTEVQQLHGLAPAHLMFLCNPNNPTGVLHGAQAIAGLLREQPDRLVVLDEAYAPFAVSGWRSEVLLAHHPNLVVLRSLTKQHALPGLRLGYLLAAPELAHAVEAVRPPWSVNAGALRAGLAMLEPEADAHVERARQVVTAARGLLSDGMSRLGYRVKPSAANFLLVDVGDAAGFRRALLQHGLIVRDCTSFGLPEYARIACRLPEECEKLLEVVKRLKEAGSLPQLRDVSY